MVVTVGVAEDTVGVGDIIFRVGELEDGKQFVNVGETELPRQLLPLFPNVTRNKSLLPEPYELVHPVAI